jgi:ABC-type nitrate/sulfonate/bicarbonate transport system substrate-binding protein
MLQIRRLLLAMMALCALTFVVAACGGDDEASESSQSKAGPTTKIDPAKVKTKTWRVAVDNPHYLFQEDALIAQEKGYFKEYGIDGYKGSVTDTPIQAMLGGSVDMILFDTDTVIGAGAKTKQKLPVVAMYIENEANILGVRKGINSAEDLKKTKAKIAVSGRGTRSFVKMQQLLTENGIDPDKDVELLDTGGQSNERLQQTINGTVDGGSVQLRHETILKDAGGKFLFKKVYPSPQLAWATTEKKLKEDPEGVAAFLAATLKARQFILDQKNKDDVLGLMETKKFELPPSFKDAYSTENAADYRGADGGWNPDLMDAFVKEAIDLKVIPPNTDWREYVDLTPLWRAQKAVGLKNRPSPSEMGQ